jgi:hypothetical protein
MLAMNASYWPEGLEVKDTRTPADIINQAIEEWAEKSEGKLRIKYKMQDSKYIYSVGGNNLFEIYYSADRSVYAAIKSLTDKYARFVWCRSPKEFELALAQILNNPKVKLIATNILVAGSKQN